MNRLHKFSMVIGHTKSPWLRQQSSSTKSHVLQMFAFVLFPLLLRQVEGQALQNLFKVALYGANEVGYPGAPTASGSAEIDFDLGADVVYFKISFVGISEPVAIQLEAGSSNEFIGAGTSFNSATVVEFLRKMTIVQNPNPGRYTVIGAVGVAPELTSAILTRPSNYYIQVFTREYPRGACRGNLVTSDTSVSLTISNSDPQAWKGGGLP